MTGTSCSAHAASTMAAASGSWKTLNSAAAVALLISTPPPMKTIRPIRANACGCTRASSARLVIGASGTTVTGCARGRLRVDGVAEEVDRRAGVGAQGRGRHLEVGHAVGAVHVAGVDRLLEDRPRGTDADRHVAAAGGLEHQQGVAHDVGQRGVAAHAGDRPQVEPRVQRGEEEGAGVVDSGVDVEDHGKARHGVDHGGCGRTPTTRRGWRTLRRRAGRTACSPRVDQRARHPGCRHSAVRGDVTYRRRVLSATSRPLHDPPPGRHHLRPAGPGARRVRGRPGRFGHLARTHHAGPLLTGRHECHVERDAQHGIRLAHPGRRGGLRVVDGRGA